MTAIDAAAFWIGLNLILFVYLSARVGQARLRYKISLGDGGNPDMAKAIRTHANYTEYAPLILIGLFAVASLGAPVMLVHGLGAAFFFARVAHLLGLGMDLWSQGRRIGAMVTGLVLVATAGSLIYYALA